LREKVADEVRRMKGRRKPSRELRRANGGRRRDPSTVGFADTFSRKGRRN